MTITNGYTTLTVVKGVAALNLSSTASDADLEMIIENVSRSIDEECGRFFYTTASQSRYFTAKDWSKLSVTDISSTAVTIYTDDDGDGTYENTWSSTDYILSPYNALTDGKPIEFIEVAPSGIYRFPVGVPRGVKVTAPFGWPAVPKYITWACAEQSIREFQRFKTAQGVAGTSATGTITFTAVKLDPDVQKKINEGMKVQF